ncbi:hypothetical protein QOZ84_12840 [Romboutsia sedimentorum]|uniref:Uncharacterized protein n=1 Tax=Romboutsia sedimentorum TaxID=1368474 RepID=A0ABT7ECK2_9FIRM|nr:hypothetical protein [Romboutsia sedimentorum]MDK2564427.1 hypothetical protein [Romboutsia sedimentorum]
MSQIINWICLICISLLVMDVMVYFCKDVIKILNGAERIKSKNVVKTRVATNEYTYETKIAK